MKHIKVISQAAPAKANVLQEVVCQLLVSTATLLGLGGGSFPAINYGVIKCDIPTPNDET